MLSSGLYLPDTCFLIFNLAFLSHYIFHMSLFLSKKVEDGQSCIKCKEPFYFFMQSDDFCLLSRFNPFKFIVITGVIRIYFYHLNYWFLFILLFLFFYFFFVLVWIDWDLLSLISYFLEYKHTSLTKPKVNQFLHSPPDNARTLVYLTHIISSKMIYYISRF